MENEKLSYYQRNRTKLLEYQKQYEKNKHLTLEQKESKKNYNRHYYHLVRKLNPEFKEKCKIFAQKYRNSKPKPQPEMELVFKMSKTKPKIKIVNQIKELSKCKVIITQNPDTVLI